MKKKKWNYKNKLWNSKECRLLYLKLFSKQENCVETQNEILNNIPNSMKNEHNEHLTKLINKNELKQAINQMQNE